MKNRTITTGDQNIVEVLEDGVLIEDAQDAVELIANTPSDHIILYEHNLGGDFFDLSTRKLGEVLQKFANYRVKLAIVGDFGKYPSSALKSFIYETNRYGEFVFASSVEEALRVWEQAR